MRIPRRSRECSGQMAEPRPHRFALRAVADPQQIDRVQHDLGGVAGHDRGGRQAGEMQPLDRVLDGHRGNPAKPVSRATGASLFGNGPSPTASTKNSSRKIVFAPSSSRSAGMFRASKATSISRTRAITAMNSEVPEPWRSRHGCRTPARPRVTKLPVTWAGTGPAARESRPCSDEAGVEASKAAIRRLLLVDTPLGRNRNIRRLALGWLR